MVSANTIDISEFQDPSTFDYQAAKDAGIKAIIIRESHGLVEDKHVKEHIANAKKYGFKWHLYHYWENVSGESNYAVRHAQTLGLTSNQFFFLDMEDKSLPANWNEQFTDFRNTAKGIFRVGLYCSDSPYQSKFSDSQMQSLKVARWIASYSYEPKNYDIWQMSGAGSGGFGTYTSDVDRDYDKAGVLTSDSSSGQPKIPTGPSNPGYRAIILEDGIDTDTGVYGRGYSYDNGKSFYVTDTTYGRKYRQEDGDRIAPFLKPHFDEWLNSGPITASIKWANILDKPDLSQYVTQSEIKDLKTKVSASINQVPTITSGTLADLASKNGSYHYEIDFIPSDAPDHNWGMCDVVVGENYAKEVFTDTSTTDVYVRTRKSESWSEWRQITLWN